MGFTYEPAENATFILSLEIENGTGTKPVSA